MDARQGVGEVLDGRVVVVDVRVLVAGQAEQYRCVARPQQNLLRPLGHQRGVGLAQRDRRVVHHDREVIM